VARDASLWQYPSELPRSKRAPSGPRWIHEIKHDGYRLICRFDESGIRCWSRHRTNFTGAFPRIDDALRQLPVSAALDGEVIVELPSGHHDFEALRTTAGRRNACYLAFDLLMLAGNDLRMTPLIERRAMLAELLDAPPRSTGYIPRLLQLRDDAFETQATNLREDLLAITFEVFLVSDGRRVAETEVPELPTEDGNPLIASCYDLRRDSRPRSA
jgi:ATP-dependent DNA ligase